MEKSLKILIKPRWNEIEGVRDRCCNFLQSHGFAEDAVYAYTMVLSELVENSIKYGNYVVPENKVTVKVYIYKATITLEVVHPVDEATLEHLRRLDRMIQWIRGFQDPFEAYIKRFKEVSKKPLNDEESGLGLVRISYEGKAILDFFLSEGNILNVSAVANFA